MLLQNLKIDDIDGDYGLSGWFTSCFFALSVFQNQSVNFGNKQNKEVTYFPKTQLKNIKMKKLLRILIG